MSSNICLDPRSFYNFQTLSCDAPPDCPKGPIPANSSLLQPLQPVHAGSKPQIHRGIEEFRTAILQSASKGISAQLPRGRSVSPMEFSVFAFLPLGCGSDAPAKGSYKKSYDGGENPPDSGHTTGGSGGAAGTGGTSGTGGSSGTDAGIGGADAGSTHAVPAQAVLFATTPCGPDGTIPDLDNGIGVCANYIDNQHHLFSWDPQSPGSGDAGSNSILELGFRPDQVLKGSGEKYFITYHGNFTEVPPAPAGLAVIDNGLAMQSQTGFPMAVLDEPAATSAGNMVAQVNPSFPKGLAQVGQRVFIATSNLVTWAKAQENYFNPGTVLIFNTGSSSWEHKLVTTDFNPTSVAVVNGKVYVVNSGDVNPARDAAQIATTPSSIDIINPMTLQIEKNIPLGMATTGKTDGGIDAGHDGGTNSSPDGGMPTAPTGPRENLAAGIQGEIAVSPDGKTLVLPTGDNSGRLIVLDLASETGRLIPVTTGAKVLLTGITFHPSNEFLYVGNFNDGKIYTVNLKSGQVVGNQSLDQDTTNSSGISDGLWQSASVFMGVGPEIYRLPVSH